VDKDSLSSRLKFTPDWDGIGLPGISEQDETHVEIPAHSKWVYLKLGYTDRTESPIEKIEVRADHPSNPGGERLPSSPLSSEARRTQ
jgi:hypothetical protein